MPFDMRGDYGGPGGSGGGKSWPEGYASPRHIIEIHDIFHKKGSDFLDNMTQAEAESWQVQTAQAPIWSTEMAEYASVPFFEQIEEQKAFIQPLQLLLSLPQGCVTLRAAAMESSDKTEAAEKIHGVNDFLEHLKYTGESDVTGFIEHVSQYPSAQEMFGKNFTVEALKISKATFKDWLQHRYDHAPEEATKPGKHEFSKMMEQIDKILGLERKRGSGWAHRQ